jgi:hypothetical protein
MRGRFVWRKIRRLRARVCLVRMTRHGERRFEMNIVVTELTQQEFIAMAGFMEFDSVVRRLLWLCGQQGRMTMARGSQRPRTWQVCDGQVKRRGLSLLGTLDSRAGQAVETVSRNQIYFGRKVELTYPAPRPACAGG